MGFKKELIFLYCSFISRCFLLLTAAAEEPKLSLMQKCAQCGFHVNSTQLLLIQKRY